MAQPDNSSSNLTAKKLLKVRRRLGIGDLEQMACMVQATLIQDKRKQHGTLYVFESTLGFVTKVFGIKQQQVFPFDTISEVLRESFTLKKEELGIDVVLKNNKTVTFYPLSQHVDDAFDAIYRCNQSAGNLKKMPEKIEEGFTHNPHATLNEADGADAMAKLIEKVALLASLFCGPLLMAFCPAGDAGEIQAGGCDHSRRDYARHPLQHRTGSRRCRGHPHK